MQPLVEILSFEGCPNSEGAAGLVTRVGAELRIEPRLRMVDVPDVESAQHERFLGSPTIRVDGRDIEPGADDRTDYVLSCRLYRTECGVSGQPDVSWLRRALEEAVRQQR